MYRAVAVVLFCVGLFFLGQPPHAQLMTTGVGPGGSGAGGGGPVLALDGTPQQANSAGATSVALPALSGLSSGDIIIVVTLANGAPVITPTDTASVSWTLIGTAGTGSSLITSHWGLLAGTSDTITVNQTSSTFIAGAAFAIKGANTSVPLDAAAVTANTDAGLAITTVNANTFIVGAFRSAILNNTAGGSFNLLIGANFITVESLIVSATQSGLSVAQGTPGSNGCMTFAIKH